MEYSVIVAIIGLAVGSFLNVMILRLPEGKNFLTGRSRCTSCATDLQAIDLVPVLSYCALGGKCRHCGACISVQYPLVEAATAVLFVALYAVYGLTLIFILYAVIVSGLIVLFVHDLHYKVLPDAITLPVLGVALFAAVLHSMPLLDLVAGVAVGGGFFLLQFLFSRGKWIGGGDIRLGAIGGALVGWPQVLVFLFIAYVLGSLVSIVIMLFSKKITLQSTISFGPYLITGILITLFFGTEIMSWYLGRL